jgi:hypothetical protein
MQHAAVPIHTSVGSNGGNRIWLVSFVLADRDRTSRAQDDRCCDHSTQRHRREMCIVPKSVRMNSEDDWVHSV